MGAYDVEYLNNLFQISLLLRMQSHHSETDSALSNNRNQLSTVT